MYRGRGGGKLRGFPLRYYLPSDFTYASTARQGTLPGRADDEFGIEPETDVFDGAIDEAMDNVPLRVGPDRTSSSSQTTPPTVTLPSVSPDTLSPANHERVPVNVRAAARDACDLSPVCSVSRATSSEPTCGLGHGDAAPDWVITGPLSVRLPAQRATDGRDQICSVEVSCSDASHNTSTVPRTVAVKPAKTVRAADFAILKIPKEVETMDFAPSE